MIPLASARQNVGREVVYKPRPLSPPEPGMITEVRQGMIFVHYAGDVNPKATRPADLYWPHEVIG